MPGLNGLAKGRGGEMVHPSKATCSRGGPMDLRHNAENTETVMPIAGTSG